MNVLFKIGTVIAGALLIVTPAGAAQSSERLTDADVRRLIDNVDQARDRFEDQLDGKVKSGIVRGAAGEIQVKSSLEDFDRDVTNLKSRFSDGYAASAEAQAVLRRANALQAIMEAQPSGTKGASEWEKLAAELRVLAAAYNAAFPLPEGAATRRMNDAELVTSAMAITAHAEVVKKAVNADKTLVKAEKETLKAEVESLIKQARLLESRLQDHKPATAEMRTLREKIELLTAPGRQLPPDALKAVGAMRGPIGKLNQAFGFATPTT